MMITWRNFDRWARANGYAFQMQGTGDEAIIGVTGNGRNTPIATGRHNHPGGVPDRVLQEIAYRLNMTKHALEQQM